MATILPSPRTLTSSLTVQIGEAERRLQKGQRLVGVRGVALRRGVQEWMADPAALLWAGGMGFLIGEVTRRQGTKPQDSSPAPNPGHSFFDTARSVVALATLVRPLFSARPGASTSRPSESDAAAQVASTLTQSADPAASPGSAQRPPVGAEGAASPLHVCVRPGSAAVGPCPPRPGGRAA
jgi:hypothetical protein